MATAYASCTTCASTRAGCSRLAFLSRIVPCLDGSLQTLDIGEVVIAGDSRWSFDDRSLGLAAIRDHLRIDGDAAVPTQGQLLPVGHGHRNRTGNTGD